MLPDHSTIKMIGYADDNNILISSNDSLLEVNKTVELFESATCSRVNKNHKSKIFGMGKWKRKDSWPISWLKIEDKALFTLGIFHDNGYSNTLTLN